MKIFYLICFCLIVVISCLPHKHHKRHNKKKHKKREFGKLASNIARGVKRQFDIQCSDTKCCWVHTTGHDSHDHNCGLNLHPIRHHYPIHEDPCNHGDTCGRKIRHCGVCRCLSPHMHHGYNRCGRCICGSILPGITDSSSCNCAYDTHGRNEAIGTGAVQALECNYEDDEHPCTHASNTAFIHPRDAHHTVVPATSCRLWKDDQCIQDANDIMEEPLPENPKLDPVHVYSSLGTDDGALHASVPSGSKDVPNALNNNLPSATTAAETTNQDLPDTPAVKTANALSNPTPVLTANENTYEQIPIATTNNDVYPLSAREEPTDVEIEPTDADIAPEQKSSTYAETVDNSLVDPKGAVGTTVQKGSQAVTKTGVVALQKNDTSVNTLSDIGVQQSTTASAEPLPKILGSSVNMAAPLRGSSSVNMAAPLRGSSTAGPLHGNVDLLENGNVINSINSAVKATNVKNNRILENNTQNELSSDADVAQRQATVGEASVNQAQIAPIPATHGDLLIDQEQTVSPAKTVQHINPVNLLKFVPSNPQNKVVTVTSKANGLPLVNPRPVLSSQSKSVPPSRVTLNDRTDPRVSAVSNELTHEADEVLNPAAPVSTQLNKHLTTNLPVVGKIESKADEDDDVDVMTTNTVAPNVVNNLKIPSDADVAPELLKTAPNAAAATTSTSILPQTVMSRVANPTALTNGGINQPSAVVRKPGLGVINNVQVAPQNKTLDGNGLSKEKLVV